MKINTRLMQINLKTRREKRVFISVYGQKNEIEKE